MVDFIQRNWYYNGARVEVSHASSLHHNPPFARRPRLDSGDDRLRVRDGRTPSKGLPRRIEEGPLRVWIGGRMMPWPKGRSRESSWIAGKKHTEEARKKMSAAQKGRIFSDDHKAKISAAKRGAGNAAWNGGIHHHDGRVYEAAPGHPHAVGTTRGRAGYVFRSRLVMERHLGRYLAHQETVHHINGDKTDDRIENLMLFSTPGEHSSFHAKTRENKVCAQRGADGRFAARLSE
jgi:hypothetical protein